MEPWAPARKILASVEMPRAPARFLANGHLSLVSRQSCMSVIDKSDNEMIPGAMHRSPDIYLTLQIQEKNSNLERDLNLKPPGPGSNFSLEFKL